MKFRIISPKVHGVIDYAAAAALIVVPFVLNFGAISAIALWFSVVAGTALIGYSLVTDYAPGLTKVLPMNLHLAFDLAAAVGFLVAIPVLGFEGIVAGYYAVMALSVIAVVVLTDSSVVEDLSTTQVPTEA